MSAQVTPEGKLLPSLLLRPVSQQECQFLIESTSLTWTPPVLWAQRSSSSDAEKNYVYLTISVPDVPPKSLKLDLRPTGLTFTGASETKKTTYHLEMEFFSEIDVENSKTHHTAANIQMILRKKELKEEYWPRLLKDPAKVHYLRTDFDKVSQRI